MNFLDTIQNHIANLFAAKIEVHMEKEVFTFASKKGVFPLKTCVFLKRDRRAFKIVSFGIEGTKSIAHKKIELFSKNSKSDYECLKQFIKYGLSLTTNKHAVIRPSIICKGLENFSEFFSGYEHGIFLNLFIEAGALDVDFITS